MLVEGLRVKRKKMHAMYLCTGEMENEIDRLDIFYYSHEPIFTKYLDISISVEWNKNRQDLIDCSFIYFFNSNVF